MRAECSPALFEFASVDGRAVVAGFDGGAITSDAGAPLLGAADRAIGLVRRFAACFRDARAPERVEHEVAALVGQRVFGAALGYEDLVDHDQLRHDPVPFMPIPSCVRTPATPGASIRSRVRARRACS
jgi:Transposase DDE domain group 1